MLCHAAIRTLIARDQRHDQRSGAPLLRLSDKRKTMTRFLVISAFILGIVAVWFAFRYGSAYGLTILSRVFPG